MEVEHMIDSLKAAGKKFEYKIYQRNTERDGEEWMSRLDSPF